MTDLWTEATYDHESLAREAALDRVTAELEGVMPFLLMARSDAEFAHRIAMARGRLEAIALTHGIEPQAVMDMAIHHYAIKTEALAEGEDPLDTMLQSTRGYGSGPEVQDHHDTAYNPGLGYAEVPQGAPGGPAPNVVQPQFPGPEPMIDAQAARKHAKKLRKKADASQGGDYLSQTPPDLGTGSGSQDIGVEGPSGPPSVPAGLPGASTGPMVPPAIGRVTSSKDPIRRQVLAVAESIRATNPWLPEHDVMRVARTTVGRYFPKAAGADWSQNPVDDSPPRQTGDGGSGGGGMAAHMLEGQGLRSMLPGGGAGAGAGAAGSAAEVAELAAL